MLQDYLAWAEQDWPAAPRRLWQHYLLNMRPQSLATQLFARWLEIRVDKLTPPLRDFSLHWDLFTPDRAVDKIAGSLLAGPDLIGEIVNLRVDRERFLKSACLLSVFTMLGHHLREHTHPTNITITLRQLLVSLGSNPIHQMQGYGGLGESAQKSLVEGLVIWADRQGEPYISQTLELLHVLIGDPRLSYVRARWSNIDSSVRQTVEGWLSKITLDSFFRVMRALPAKRNDMVEERERFWRAYREKIIKAWLITGKDGEQLARQLLEKSYGSLVGNGVLSDHLGLMLQLGGYVILEMNQTGSTLFWAAGDQQMPGFFESQYNISRLRKLCEQGNGRFKLTHHPGWQKNYASTILSRTGISR